MFINDKTNPDRLPKGRWVTLLFQIIIGSIMTFTYILTIYVGSLSEKFGWSVGSVLMTFTVAMWVGSPAQILGGIIRDKIGNRATIVYGGIVYGLAIILSGFVSTVIGFIILQGIVASSVLFIVSVAQYQNIGALFPDKRGLTMGLMSGGISVGTAFMAPFATYLCEAFSVTASLVVQGTLYAVICVIFGLLIVNAPDDYIPEGWDPESEKNETALEKGHLGLEVDWKQLFKLPALYLLWIGLACTTMICFALSSNLSLMAQEATGIGEMEGAWMVSANSVALGVGGILMGFIADHVGPVRGTVVMAVVEGILLLILSMAGSHTVAGFAILAIVTGFAFGTYTTTLAMITMNFFGTKNFGVNFGIVSLNALIANLVAPQLTVHLSIGLFLLITGILSLVGAAALIIARKTITEYAMKVISADK